MEKWKCDYFQSQAGGDKRLVAHHQAEPAAVVSVGKEVQRNQHPFWGERSLLHGIVIKRGGAEVSAKFSSKSSSSTR